MCIIASVFSTVKNWQTQLTVFYCKILGDMKFGAWLHHFVLLNIAFSSPDLQTRGIVPSLVLSGQPFQSINWTCVGEKFLLRAPEWMNRPLRLPFPLFSCVSFPQGRRSATAGALSDEKDKWQRCLGSGGHNSVWSNEGNKSELRGGRVKVTDVSGLTMRNMISSLPVIQTYMQWHPSSQHFNSMLRFVPTKSNMSLIRHKHSYHINFPQESSWR